MTNCNSDENIVLNIMNKTTEFLDSWHHYEFAKQPPFKYKKSGQ